MKDCHLQIFRVTYYLQIYLGRSEISPNSEKAVKPTGLKKFASDWTNVQIICIFLFLFIYSLIYIKCTLSSHTIQYTRTIQINYSSICHSSTCFQKSDAHSLKTQITLSWTVLVASVPSNVTQIRNFSKWLFTYRVQPRRWRGMKSLTA